MDETWKLVPKYEGYYEVSNTNKVKSLDREIVTKNGVRKLKGKVLNQHKNGSGYYFVGLSKDGVLKYKLVHVLVASAFPEICGVPFEGAEINHKDEDKSNNTPENLEYISHKSNINYGTGRKKWEEKVSKPVYQLDSTGKVIKRWDFIKEAASFYHVDRSNIYACCDGKQKTASGFKWRYA